MEPVVVAFRYFKVGRFEVNEALPGTVWVDKFGLVLPRWSFRPERCRSRRRGVPTEETSSA